MKFCEQEIGINKNTTVFWCKKIREMMANVCFTKQDGCVGGNGVTVEIDESNFTRNKGKKGRKFPLQWVFGGFERGSKKVFLVKVEGNRNRATLEALIKKHIKTGTHIISDQWPVYKRVKDLPGYTHSIVNHTKGFVNKADRTVHTQNIECTCRLAKHRNKVQCPMCRPQLDNYLCDFMYRRLHAGCDDIFLQIMKDLVEFAPPKDGHQRQEVMEEGNPNDEEEVMEEGSVNDEAGSPPPLEPDDEGR